MIGILAGMGPKSTGPFIDLVVSELQSLTGAKNDIDFPPMMIYSCPTPFWVDRPIDHVLMEQTICNGLKKLEACGASFIAMPCNTAHLYFSKLQSSIRIPLLNIVDVTLACIPHAAHKITILGTRPTLESQVYQKGLDHAHLHYILNSAWQEKIDAIISGIKTAEDSSTAVGLWEDLSSDFLKAGVDTVVLACTDLNVIFKSVHSSFRIIDSSRCLADAVVKKCEELK